ncbi:MAG: hypothetical protein ACI32C_01775 [Candidatus Enteromonas sp.]
MKKKEESLEIDESQLTEGQKAEMQKGTFPWGILIFIGVLLALIGICLIVVFALS